MKGIMQSHIAGDDGTRLKPRKLFYPVGDGKHASPLLSTVHAYVPVCINKLKYMLKVITHLCILFWKVTEAFTKSSLGSS